MFCKFVVIISEFKKIQKETKTNKQKHKPTSRINTNTTTYTDIFRATDTMDSITVLIETH